MQMRRLLVAAVMMGAAAAQGAKPALERLPPDKLAAMPPLLRHGDVALIESQPSGRLRQITVVTLVKAPPKVVHDVVADPARQPEYVHNMSKSAVVKNADGTIDHTWVLDFTVTSFNGTTRYQLDPDGTIGVASTDPEDNAIFRWEFLEAPGTGGAETVLVMYGYTDVLHSNGLIRSIVKGAPMMEHGLALAAHLVTVRSFKQRAEELARHAPPTVGPPPSGAPTITQGAAPRSPGFGFLLDRGKVAVVRSNAQGRLSEISLMDRVYAPQAKVAEVIERPGDYERFVDTVKKSRVGGQDADGTHFSLELSIPLVSWESEYLMRRDARSTAHDLGIDGAAVGGDLRGARFRWDLAEKGPKETLVTLRAQEELGASSLVLRTLFKQEPLFEHGIAVALGLVELNGVRGHAEGWK